MSLALRLAENGRLYPAQEAIVYHEHRLTYSDLVKKINQLANGLKKFGIAKGERIFIALENCPEFIISFFAVMQIKGILVPVSSQYTPHELSMIMKDASAAVVITDHWTAPTFARLREKIDIPKGIIVIDPHLEDFNFYSFEQILASGEIDFTFDDPPGGDDIVEILYTHSNMVTPQGVQLTNNNLYSNAHVFAELCRLTVKDRSLLVAPVYHSAAQTFVMNSSLLSGATLVVHDGWSGPEAVLRTIQEEKITFFFGPPTMYALLVDYYDLKRFNTSSWRVAFSAAASLPPEIFCEFEKKFGFQITEGYGLTQTSPLVCSNPIEGPKKAGSVGVPVPGVKIKIVDYEDKEVPAGQVGEIVVTGPNVMKGYYNREEETKWVMRNGWLHTDDLAYIDDDGYVYIIDRKKDLIIRGGLNVHPREIEDVLYTHPKIFDAAVIGVPDPVWGEEVMAVVLLRENQEMTAKELQVYCQDKLASYKIPHYVHFVEDIPKTFSGKLLKHELKQMIEGAGIS